VLRASLAAFNTIGLILFTLPSLAIAGVIAALAAAFASGDPDGLDSVAIEQGFEGAGQEPGFEVLPDYTIPGLDGTQSTILAGIVGIAIVFGLMLVLGRLLARRRSRAAARP
jgi:cobalt/nickel transport system permease protein